MPRRSCHRRQSCHLHPECRAERVGELVAAAAAMHYPETYSRVLQGKRLDDRNPLTGARREAVLSRAATLLLKSA